MNMTAEEIVRHYRQAKDPKNDIQVLADLNGTDTASIRAILIDAGELAPDGKVKKKPGAPENRAERDAIIRRMLAEGHTWSETAAAAGCTQPTVARVAREMKKETAAEPSRAEPSRAEPENEGDRGKKKPERPPIRREKGKPNVNSRMAAILYAVPEEAPDSVKARAVDLCKEMMNHAEL